jgi:hypothetical protein
MLFKLGNHPCKMVAILLSLSFHVMDFVPKSFTWFVINMLMFMFFNILWECILCVILMVGTMAIQQITILLY